MTVDSKSLTPTPLVSYIIPSYNHSIFVKESIESVINQNYPMIELIVIDDGSTDDSIEIIKSLVDACKKRFYRFEFRSRGNLGVCKTLNEGLAWCKGDFISILASDDIIISDKVSAQVDYLISNPETKGVFGAIDVMYTELNKTFPVKYARKQYFFEDILLHNHKLPAATNLLRSDAVRAANGFNEEFEIEDWPLWLALTEGGGSLDNLGVLFATYRRHNNNLSSKTSLMHRARRHILSKYQGHVLYKKALANSYLVTATEVTRQSKIKSLFYYVKAVRISPSSLWSERGRGFLKRYMRILFAE